MGLERLLLLSCRSPFLDDSKIYVPMANLVLKSWLNQKVPEVEVVLGDDDYDLENPEYFEPYTHIGLSIMTPQREEASKILRAIKSRYPDKVVIAGGPHVKHYAKEMMSEPYDWIIPKDGEKALEAIFKRQTNSLPHRYIRTSFSSDDGREINNFVMDDITDPRILVSTMNKDDLETAPRPDRTSENAREVLSRYHYTLGGKKSTTMMTARGCTEMCKFCEDARTSIRWSGMESIIGQLDDIKELGYEGVYLFDDLFAIALHKIKPICDEIKQRDLIYRCNAQARYFTKWGDQMAKLLADTGCYEIAFGAESGSQKILDGINKRTTVEANYETIKLAAEHGIITKAFILLGLPGETNETMRETEKMIEYLMKVNPKNDFGAYVFYPYKGTQLRDSLDRGEDIGLSMLNEGLGAYGQTGGNTEKGVIRTTHLNNDELVNFRDYLVRTYKPASSSVMWQQNQKYRQESLPFNDPNSNYQNEP